MVTILTKHADCLDLVVYFVDFLPWCDKHIMKNEGSLSTSCMARRETHKVSQIRKDPPGANQKGHQIDQAPKEGCEMTDVDANVSEPAVAVGKGRKSVRNVFVALGLMAVIPALFATFEAGDISKYGWYATHPFMMVIASAIVAIFARSFWDVLVTSGFLSNLLAVFWEIVVAIAPTVFWISVFFLPAGILVLPYYLPILFISGFIMRAYQE